MIDCAFSAHMEECRTLPFFCIGRVRAQCRARLLRTASVRGECQPRIGAEPICNQLTVVIECREDQRKTIAVEADALLSGEQVRFAFAEK